MLSLQDFAPLEGQDFAFAGDGAAMTATLVEVTPLPPVPSAERDSFSLVFRSASAAPCPQGIYTLHHDALDADPIFLVPIARDADGILYQAVFN